MSEENNRVLNRMGARQLTKDELDNIGAGIPTLLSIIRTGPLIDPDQFRDS